MSEPSDWLWDRAPCGYARISLDGEVLHTNRTFQRWLADASISLEDLGAAFSAGVAPILRDAGSLEGVPFRLGSPDALLAGEIAGAVDSEGVARLVVHVPDAPRDDTELVRALQQTLIPPAPPSVAGLDVAAAYHPAQGEVGGDFYDVFEVADADWCVVIGDVSGKGVDAAIVTAAARHAVRSSALREPTPSGLLRALNAALVDQASSRFCTVALLRLQRRVDTWAATFATGGHPFPLLVRHGTVTKMGRAGSLLGVFDEVTFTDVSIRLASGDALVLYTDGVIEARNASGEFYGEERMHKAIVGHARSAQQIVDAVVSDVLEFEVSGVADDVAVVVIRRP